MKNAILRVVGWLKLSGRELWLLLSTLGLTFLVELPPDQVEHWARANGWRVGPVLAALAVLRLWKRQRDAAAAGAAPAELDTPAWPGAR